MWEPNRSALGKNFHFISFDFPGFGETPLVSDNSTMEEMADHVAAVLETQAGREKIVLVGVSMGGYVMLPFLKKYPDRVRAVAFVSTRSTADSEEAKARRFATIDMIQKEGIAAFAPKIVPQLLGKTTQKTNPALVEKIAKWIEQEKPAAICAALRGMAARPDRTDVLAQVQVPALFIWGEEDALIKQDEMRAMAEHIKISEFHSIPQAGHLPSLEKPDAFNDLFLKFLKRRVL